MRNSMIVVGVLGLVGAGAWHLHHHHGARGGKLVQDRVWIDHLPRNDRDTVNVFAAISSESVGLFQGASAWHGVYDVFRYEANADQLRLVFPHTGTREQLRAAARECSEGGFDYCLEISGSTHGVARYYSMEGWEIESEQAAEAKIHQLELGAAK